VIVYISKIILGTDFHLGWDGKKFIKQFFLSDEDWVFDDTVSMRSLRPLCDLKSVQIDFPGDVHKKIWSQIPNVSFAEIKWSLTIPGKSFKASVKNTLEQLWELLKSVEGTYYINEFYVIRKLLLSLSAAKIDSTLYHTIMRNPNANKNSLGGFQPNKQGYAKVSVYNQTKTVSGRLVVESGPNILTLKKEYRKILKSRYANGAIIQVDFVSLEPRVLLTFLEKKSQRDVYKQIAKDVFEGKVDRTSVKILTLGVVYGLSPNSLADKLGVNQTTAKRLNKKIRNYFRLDDMTQLLISTAESGKIANMYGREINVSGDAGYVLINRFIQSSAADAALTAFALFTKNLSKISDKILPIFLIHDAVILDVPEEYLEDIKIMCAEGLDVPVLNKKFPVQIDIIRQN
jgi:hypothetical protein